jgi:hypothetical protein
MSSARSAKDSNCAEGRGECITVVEFVQVDQALTTASSKPCRTAKHEAESVRQADIIMASGGSEVALASERGELK